MACSKISTHFDLKKRSICHRQIIRNELKITANKERQSSADTSLQSWSAGHDPRRYGATAGLTAIKRDCPTYSGTYGHLAVKFDIRNTQKGTEASWGYRRQLVSTTVKFHIGNIKNQHTIVWEH